MAHLLTNACNGWMRIEFKPRRSAVDQEIFLDPLPVGLEHDRGAAQLPDLLLGALDHAVALAGLLVKHLPAPGHLEALLGAGLGLELGHLALLAPATVTGRCPARRICSSKTC